uniref:RNA-dependent RNA polymerase n=1 Tax=Panagrolaimus superbus TaxID=310955 RepID=A0A914ZFF1_9BILA
MNQLYSCLPRRTITFGTFTIIDYIPPDESKLIIATEKWEDEDANYYIRCIQSLGTVGHFFLDYYLFKMENIKQMTKADGKCDCEWADIVLRSIYLFLKKDISLPSLDLNPTMYDYTKKERFGTTYVPIKTVIITPTKIRFELEEDTVNCRGFRKLGAERILQVKFRDENLQWFPRDPNILKTAMFAPLIDGITVGNKHYYDFGASSSLFREHGTYFFETSDRDEIVDIISGWGNFKYEPAAKLAARLGQYFTSAKEIKTKLRRHEIGILDDYETDDKQFVFSDGVGIIDPAYARQIQTEFRLHYTPSAFQIRCLGCKGMVTVDPYNKNLESNGGKYKVMFRDSQKKFDAKEDGDIDFDVAQFSAPCPVKLHRSFIALLVALARDQGKLEIVEKRLHELLSQSFMDILKSLNDPDAFVKVLKQLPKYFPVAKLASTNLINEPFLRALVEAFAVFNAT